METLRNRIHFVLILCRLLCNFHVYLLYVIKFGFSFYLIVFYFSRSFRRRPEPFPTMTRPLSVTQPYPNATRTLSDDDPKLSTNRNAPRTMGTQGATNAAHGLDRKLMSCGLILIADWLVRVSRWR